MKFLITLGLALLLLSLEAAFIQFFGLTSMRVEVTVPLIALLALRASTIEGAVSAYALGYLLDLMSGRPTGVYTFLGVLVFLFGRVAASVVDVRSAMGFVLFVAGADAAHGVLAVFFVWLTSRGGQGLWSLLAHVPLQVLLTAIVARLLYPLLRRMDPAHERPQFGALR